MKARPRLLAAALLIAGVAGVLAWLGSAPGEAAGVIDVPRRFQSSTECRECHRAVWEEWHGSQHQISYLNPEVRALSDDFRNKECQACHLPRPVAVTGYGQRVLPRQTFPDEGVSCLTCHQAADGGIVGRRDGPTAPCGVRASADLVSVALCESCHNQHQTTDQWRATRFAAAGTDCNACHMPEVERLGAQRPGRNHVFPGAHDVAMLRAAGRFEVEADGRDVALALTNGGAGHSLPTEERHRAVDMVVRFVRSDGTATEWQRLWRCRMPYRDEPGDDTQLPAGETRRVRVTAPADAVRAEARLWYRLTPFCDDADPRSTLLEERTVELR